MFQGFLMKAFEGSMSGFAVHCPVRTSHYSSTGLNATWNLDSTKPSTLKTKQVQRCIVGMGAIWWGTRGTCPSTFFRRGDIICYVPPNFFSLGFVFGEVSKIKVMFVTFCVKSFSC